MNAQPRMTVTFTKPQKAWLKAQAEQLGVTEGELLRRIVDKERGA